MKIIAGLGNPGEKYRYNRHNIGRLVINELFSREQSIEADIRWVNFNGAWVCRSKNLILSKAGENLFMNQSGVWLSKVKNFYKVENQDIILIYDDLDLEMGRVLISDKGPKIHNGINSVLEQIGAGIVHIRCGVDDRSGDRTVPGADYVLQNFPNREAMNKLIEEAKSAILLQI